MSAFVRFAAVLLAVLIGAACTEGENTPAGALHVVATFSDALTRSEVDSVKLTATRERPTPETITADLKKVGGQWEVTLGDLGVGSIAAGTAWTLRAEAHRSADPGRVLYRGELVGVEVTAKAAALVVLVLQQLEAPPFANGAPQIDGLVVSRTRAERGTTIDLTALAHDPDAADTLTYTWSSTGGAFSKTTDSTPAGTAATPSRVTTTWSAATAGTFTLTLVVADPKGIQDGVSATITIVDPTTPPPPDAGAPTGAAAVTSVVNSWPLFNGFVASKTLLAPSGDEITLNVFADDPDGDALDYAWSTDCGGSFGSGAATRIWTSPARPAGTDCTFTVVVSDLASDGLTRRGGTNRGTLVLHVGTLPPVMQP